jgi:long-chain fatty acid transport protein
VRRRHPAAAVLAAAFLLSGHAQAAGLFHSERGVRPLARGGAFVAGADDLGSIWYNPAGLTYCGGELMLDMGFLIHGATYSRETQVTDSGGTVRVYRFPEVKGSAVPLPSPTLAGSINVGSRREWTLAIGVYAPYTPLSKWPEKQENGQPAPQRYSLLSLDGTVLLDTGFYAAWHPVESLRVGLGLNFLVGSFANLVYLNANPSDRVLGAPEDPNYDSLTLTKATVFAPSASAGITFEPSKFVRFGLSGHLPYWINAPATLTVRLPTAAPFDNAGLNDDSARVKFRLPGVVRVGAEVRPTPELRVEVAYVYEAWSLHDTIDITPNGGLTNITGFPSPFSLPTIRIPRSFQDTHSVRLGGEYTVKLGESAKLDIRAGGSFETSAAPTPYVSALTLDAVKGAASFGLGLHVGDRWRFDVMYSHMFFPQVVVPAKDAAVPVINPVSGYPTPIEGVNGGTYDWHTDIVGIGLSFAFDPKPVEPPKSASPPAPKSDPAPPPPNPAAKESDEQRAEREAKEPDAAPPPPPPKPTSPPPKPGTKPAKPK